MPTIGDLVTLQRGNTYKSALLGLPGPVLLGLGSIQRNGGFKEGKLETYGGDSDPRMLLEPGDIYVSLKDVTQSADLLGAIARVPPHIAQGRLTQDTVKLVFKSGGVPPEFVYWLLRTPQYRAFCKSYATGTTNLGLPREDFLAYELPELTPEREVVLAALGSLDDKIELNRRMNETLEAMAQAIFRDWFVDFGPTRRKLAGIADPIEIMGGLFQDPAHAAKLAALFPAALGDNGLPEGWERRTLSECANVLSGGTPSKGNAAYWGGEIPWISPKVMTGIHVDEADDQITEQAVSEGAKLVPIGATLVMVRGMGLHDGMRVSQARREVTFNQDVKAFVAKRDVPADFLFWGILALAPEIHGKVESSGHGTGKLPSDRLLSATLAVPSADAIRELSKTLTLLNERIDLSRRESNTLAATRDLLLPKLMSGEIRLRDAEALAEAAT